MHTLSSPKREVSFLWPSVRIAQNSCTVALYVIWSNLLTAFSRKLRGSRSGDFSVRSCTKFSSVLSRKRQTRRFLRTFHSSFVVCVLDEDHDFETARNRFECNSMTRKKIGSRTFFSRHGVAVKSVSKIAPKISPKNIAPRNRANDWLRAKSEATAKDLENSPRGRQMTAQLHPSNNHLF